MTVEVARVLPQTAEYALRAVLYLAERGHPGSVPVDEMADALGNWLNQPKPKPPHPEKSFRCIAGWAGSRSHARHRP